MEGVNEAQRQADEIKDIALSATKKQLENLEEGKKLIEKTDHMTAMAKQFEREAHEMEKVQKSNSWWMGSK